MNLRTRHWSTLGVSLLGACLAGMGLGAGPAAAAVDHDGHAQGLRVQGVSVTLFEGGLSVSVNRGDLPEEVLQIPETTVTLPDLVTPTVQHPPGQHNTSAGPSMPAILSAETVEASSGVTSGVLTSTATVRGLNLLGGALTADTVGATCTADGNAVALDATYEGIGPANVAAGFSQAPGTQVTVANLTLDINEQQQQGTGANASGSISALRVEFSGGLSISALEQNPMLLDRVKAALQQFAADAEALQPPLPMPDLPDSLTIQQMIDLINGPGPTQEGLSRVEARLPEFTNRVVGTLQLADAACAQSVSEETPTPTPTPTPTVTPTPSDSVAPSVLPERHEAQTLPKTGAGPWVWMLVAAVTLLGGGIVVRLAGHPRTGRH
jgi:hypothetical protein